MPSTPAKPPARRPMTNAEAAKYRWAGKTKAERRAHMKMMYKAAVAQKRNKLGGRPRKIKLVDTTPKRPVGRPRKIV